MVCFSTCFIGWVNSSRLSLGSVIVFVVVVNVVIIVALAVWIGVIGAVVFVSRKILSIFSLFSLFFEQATLISVMSWSFTLVASWFGSVGVSV